MQRILPTCFILALCTNHATSQTSQSLGTRFHFSFMENGSGTFGQTFVNISGQTATTGTLSMPLTGYVQPFSVSPGITTTVYLSISWQYTSGTVEPYGVLVETIAPVNVVAVSSGYYSTATSNLLPEELLGPEYMVMAHEGLPGSGPEYVSELLVVATTDGSTVEIVPAASTANGQMAGIPFAITLNAHETYLVQAAQDTDDLTGTRITLVGGTACDRLAVFGGSVGTRIPATCYAAEHLYTQQLPLSKWGQSFFAAPFSSAATYTLRVLASEDNTNVWIDGVPNVLNAMDVLEENSIGSPRHIQADKPVCAAQLMESWTCSGNGDPSLVLLNSEEQGMVQAGFATVVDPLLTDHFVNITTTVGNIGLLSMDGLLVPAASFTPFVLRPDMAYASLPLNVGSHMLDAPSPFSAIAYGLGTAISYAYQVGTSLSPSIGIDSVICHAGGPLTLDAPPGLNAPYWVQASDPPDTLGTGAQLSFTPTASALLVVTDSATNVCDGGRTYSIELSIAGTLQVSTASDTACAWKSTGLFANLLPAVSADFYWEPAALIPFPNSPSVIAYPVQDTWFHLTATTPGGCWTTEDSLWVLVQPNSLVSISAAPLDTTICAGASVQLDAGAMRTIVQDTFNGSLAPWWAAVQGGVIGNSCDSLGGTSLVFGGAGMRTATTGPLDLSAGGNIRFAIVIGNGSNGCDDAEAGESIVLEASVNNGLSWNTIALLAEDVHAAFTAYQLPVPTSALGVNTIIRWRQVGWPFALNEDVWALENVAVIAPSTAGTSFLWSPSSGLNNATSPAPIATPAFTTLYSVIATDANGCALQDSVLIEVLPLPPPFTVQQVGNVLCGPVGIYTYQWYMGGVLLMGDTLPCLTVQQDGDYSVVVTATNGCTAEASALVGIDELHAAPFTITAHQGHISLSAAQHLNDLRLYAVTGQLVMERSAPLNAGGTITMTLATSGIYIVQAITADGSFAARVCVP